MVIRHLREYLSRQDPVVFRKRLAIAYATGVWTIFGFVFVFYKLNGGKPLERMKVDDHPKKERTKEEQYIRSREVAEFVADNVYTPLEFLA